MTSIPTKRQLSQTSSVSGTNDRSTTAAAAALAVGVELTPAQLAAQWKRTGSFDELRKQSINDFMSTPAAAELRASLRPLLPALLTAGSFRRVARKDRQSELMRQLDKLPQAIELRRVVERALEDKLRAGSSGRRGIEVDLGAGRPVKRIHIERELRDTLAVHKANARAAGTASNPTGSTSRTKGTSSAPAGSSAPTSSPTKAAESSKSAGRSSKPTAPAFLKVDDELPDDVAAASEMKGSTTSTTVSSGHDHILTEKSEKQSVQMVANESSEHASGDAVSEPNNAPGDDTGEDAQAREQPTAATTGVAGVGNTEQSAGAGDPDPKAPEDVQSETATVSQLGSAPYPSNRSDPTIADSEGMDVDE